MQRIIYNYDNFIYYYKPKIAEKTKKFPLQITIQNRVTITLRSPKNRPTGYFLYRFSRSVPFISCLKNVLTKYIFFKVFIQILIIVIF